MIEKFSLLTSQSGVISPLSTKQRGELLTLLLYYASTGDRPASESINDTAVAVAFEALCGDITRQIDKQKGEDEFDPQFPLTIDL